MHSRIRWLSAAIIGALWFSRGQTADHCESQPSDEEKYCDPNSDELACTSLSDSDSLPGKALLQSHAFSTKAAADVGEPTTANQKREVAGEHSSRSAPKRTPAFPQQAPDADESQMTIVGNIGCNETVFAPSGDCPSNCPFYTEESGKVCHFRCVRASDCGMFDPKMNIADIEGMYCRGCRVPGCLKCVDAGVDKCAKCAEGYLHARDGHCYSKMWLVWIGIFCFVGLVGLLLVAWYIDLRRRPTLNEDGLKEGLAFRSRLKLCMPRGSHPPGLIEGDAPETSGGRHLWPLSTSLHDVDVAGPGLLLHFNFHVLHNAWACVCVSVWIVWAYSTEIELLVLGLYSANTPQQVCAVTIHGRKAQKEMMWAKVGFLILVYLGTTAGSLLYGVFTERRYQELDEQTTSMRDYAAVVRGVPLTNGGEKLEELLGNAVGQASNQRVVGVSVAWNYRPHADTITEALEAEATALEKGEEGEPTTSTPGEPGPNGEQPDGQDGYRRGAFGFIDKQLGFAPPGDAEAEEGMSSEGLSQLVREMESTDVAFAVFETEEARDAAVEAVGDAGIKFRDGRLTLEAADNEPAAVHWEVFTIDSGKIATRMVIGVLTVLAAVAVWCVAFYYPYAQFTASFAKAHTEPGLLSGLTFSMLVVAGNQAMYQLCNQISYRVGFRYIDDAEAFYIALYTFAVFLNLVVDLVMEFFLGYSAMVDAGVHVADGRLLGELTSYQEIFESYPIQRALGSRIFAYCFPSTFFLPFVFEPIFAIFVPYHLMKHMVRTHRGVRGREAEKSLDFFAPMDLGRYGDLALNVVLTSLIFFFPAGEMLKLFLALIISHLFIYVYDKYRVLRCVPGFCFAGSSADKCAQGIIAIPCGFVCACILFKSNCSGMSPLCLHESHLAVACACAFVAHVTIHLLLLLVVCPKFRRCDKDPSTDLYEKVAATQPCTWFSANPVHCLRSRYIYEHQPPCGFFIRGREHLLRANPSIGCHYEQRSKEGAHGDAED